MMPQGILPAYDRINLGFQRMIASLSLKVKGISIIQWFCLDLLTVGFPIENSIFREFFHFAVGQNLMVR